MILALRALGIGDLATAVPALRGLRAAFPERTLALAAPRWLVPLVDLVGGIDRLIPVDGLGWYEWPAPRPHWAVNLHGRGPRSHLLLMAAGPGRLCGFACPAAGHTDGPMWRDGEHEVRRWCRLVGWYGVPSDPAELSLRRPAPDRVPVGATVVHPGGKDAQRRWPAARFAAVARRLAALGHRVVVTGSTAERGLAVAVAAGAGLSSAAVLAGRTGIAEVAALVAHARLVISADTGLGHLATAYGTRSVLLFGPVPPSRWGPPGDRAWHRVLWRADLADAAGAPGCHPALAAIGVDEVLAAVGEVADLAPVRDALAAQ